MENNKDLSYEEQHNDHFLDLSTQIKKQRSILADLEQQRDNVYVLTTFYRLEEEHKRMLDEYHDDEL